MVVKTVFSINRALVGFNCWWMRRAVRGAGRRSETSIWDMHVFIYVGQKCARRLWLEVWKMVKVREKSGNFIMKIEWQP